MKYTKEIQQLINELKLNTELLENNKVPEENIKIMKNQYKKLKQLFDNANYLYETTKLNGWSETKKGIAKDIGKQLEEIEMKLQKLWNFPQDDNFYTYWNLLPGCECPQLDNKERYGNGRIINCECPYHNFLVECKNSNRRYFPEKFH